MSEWKETTIGELLTLQRGHDLVQTEFIEGSYLVAGSNGPIGHHNSFTTEGPGLTIGRSGNSIGAAHYYALDFWAHNTVLYSKKFHNSDPKFVYYLLKSIDFKSFDGGSAVPTLNRNHVHPLQVRVPINITEQRDIAEILTSLEDKINLLHRQNKTLEQLAETLFRQWFVEEQDWKGTLSEYVKVQGGYAFKSKDFKESGFAGIMKITNISMGIIDIENSDYVDESVVKNLDHRFKTHSGDFLIAMTGAEIGKIGVVETMKKEIWVNQRVGKLDAKVPYGNIIGYLALKSREGQDHIINTCSGSAQENISTVGIEKMVFASYDFAKTNSFGGKAQPFFKKMIFNLSQIKTLAQLRNTLLPKLMSGEVRVETVIKH